MLIYNKHFQNAFFAEKNVILELVLAEAMRKFLLKKGDIDFEFQALDREEEATGSRLFFINYYTPEVLINKLKTIETYLKSVWVAYENGDIEENWKLLNSQFGQSFYDTLVAQRNRSWVPRMTKAIQKQRCFFVVGAAHLGGPQGILNLLREKGYTMHPLKWLN